MKLVFFGSAPFSTIVLQKLIDSKVEVEAVVTTPDKPVGRHLKLTPNPVKVMAQRHNIPVIEKPSEIKGGSIGLVAAYGRIIKPETLSKFNGHLYNIHPSLLPKYRGPSPLQTQILDGISETGVTIIQVDEQMDHGPIVAQHNDTILDTDTSQTLGNRLFLLGTELFLKTSLSHSKPQDENEASFTNKLTRQDGFLPYDDFTSKLQAIDPQLTTKFRAFYPWPGVWTTTPEGKRLKLVALKPQVLIQFEGLKPQPQP